MGYAVKLQSREPVKHVLYFNDISNPYAGIHATYNDNLLTYVSGSWRGSVHATTNVTYKSKVTGILEILRHNGSTSSISINGTSISYSDKAGIGKPISDSSIYDKTTINSGDNIAYSISPYYDSLEVFYSEG